MTSCSPGRSRGLADKPADKSALLARQPGSSPWSRGTAPGRPAATRLAGGSIRPPLNSAPDHAPGYAERDALIAQLSTLPARQRAVLALRYYEGLRDIEIADLIGCQPGTVRGYASRALATLRVEMDVRPGQAPALSEEKL